MSDLKFQKIIELFREQLDWKIKKGEGFYEHALRCYEIPENQALSPEKFVALYRMQFKPKYPDHPTGGVFVDGHYGEDGDMFILVSPTDNVK